MPLILQRKNLLVASATASGKTEAVIAPLVARVTSDGGRNRTRVLVIAPTRALVNDLYRRVEWPMDRVGLSCGRQTSDHRGKATKPFALITTPESLDSMLVRDGVWQEGRLEDHLLAHVEAVFIDEAHLFDGNPRGDQLPWLIGRLRRMSRLAKGRTSPTEIQICAASATVSNPESLAGRLLGDGAEIVRVSGVREIEILGPSPDAKWLPLAASLKVDAIRRSLEIVPSQDFPRRAGERLASALLRADDTAVRKTLVFVPTRKLADTLSAHWNTVLARHRELAVLAHHGSLSRARREQAEQRFLAAHDALLVATTTLEVGIDIGDVDLVALVGAPPDTRALLQRIGRGGRRVGRTRVLALPRNGAEQAALASMLQAARDGQLEPESYARRWSVFVQQAASFVAQQKVRGRRRRDLLDLANEVWPEEPPSTAETIADGLIADGHLHEHRGRVVLGDQWADRFDARGMHANIESEAPGIPVVNASTGEEIARVNAAPCAERGLALGGQTWDMQGVFRDEILLKPQGGGRVRKTFEYLVRQAPTGREYAVHVRRGLGFSSDDAPLLERAEDALWFHFAGSAFETLLLSLSKPLVPTRVSEPLTPMKTLAGLALRGVPDLQALREFASDSCLAETARTRHEEFEALLGVGPYHRLLPADTRRKVVTDLLDLYAFRRWLESRRVWTPAPDDSRRHLVDTILKARR